jgi:TetR/AcrR family transcriptional repressor of nem operon
MVLVRNRCKTESTIYQQVSSSAVAVYLISAFERICGIRQLYEDDTIIDDYLSGLFSYIRHLSA